MKPFAVFQDQERALPLTGALLIYGDRYVTRHAVQRNPGRAPTLGPGEPIERAALARLLRAAGKDSGISGWIGSRVLYVGPDVLVWHSPPQVRTMFFQCRKDEAGKSRLIDRAGPAPQPALVWAVTRGRWHVWAVKDTPCGPDTVLYQAPYMNVWESGEICTGDAALPRQLSPEVTDGFERAFFESRFTHPNAKDLTAFEGGVHALWDAMLDAREGAFPADTLLPLETTLGAAVRRLSKEP